MEHIPDVTSHMTRPMDIWWVRVRVRVRDIWWRVHI